MEKNIMKKLVIAYNTAHLFFVMTIMLTLINNFVIIPKKSVVIITAATISLFAYSIIFFIKYKIKKKRQLELKEKILAGIKIRLKKK